MDAGGTVISESNPPSPGGHAKASGYAWFVVSVLALAHLVSFLDRAVLITAMIPLKAEFHFSDLELGLLFGPAFVVLYCFATIPLGHLADRTNRKWLIVGGIAVWTLCTLAFGLARTVPELFAARVGVGLGEAALVPAALSIIASLIPRAQLGRAVGLFLVGPPYGTALALLLNGAFFSGHFTPPGWLGDLQLLSPWRLSFLAATIPGLIILLVVAMLRDIPRKTPPPAVAARADTRFFAQHWPAFVLHILAASAGIIVAQASFAWLPTYFVRAYTLGPGLVSSVIGMVTLCLTPLTAIGGGALLDWFSRRGEPAGPGLVLIGSQLLALPFYIALPMWSSPLVAAIFLLPGYVLHGPTTSASLAGLQLMTPARLRGRATAILMTCITLFGVGLGPPLTGYLSDKWFSGPRAIGMALIAVTVVFSCLSAALAFFSRPPFARAVAATKFEEAQAARG